MRPKFFYLFILIFLYFKANSQKTILSGIVKDTLNQKKLHNASVLLIRAKDSVLVKFVRTNNNGGFSFSNIAPSKYWLHISNPNYADFSDSIYITDKETELGIIPLITKGKLLEEVVVKQKIAAIRMKGDTTEYKADSFRVDANANVQDLLKRLPGITVNGKGEITAQGQTVQKVLVDGEEFFSDDPAVVTQGLRADAIDKVQVFDKKSDQAAFTGIDDGVKNKTINLQMKEDKKKGYFGKLEAGSNFNEYRNGKALVNAFKGKKKMAAYVTTDNTKFESLDWSEKRNYGEDLSSTTQINDDGGVSIWNSGDDFSWGEGFPTSTTAGAHYAQKWKEDKHNIINTYQYNNLAVNGETVNSNNTLLPDSTYVIGSIKESFDNSRNRNKLRTTYEWTIDSTSSLKAIITGSVINSKTSSSYIGSNTNSKNKLLNESNRIISSNTKDENLIGTIFWRKRFKKKGRTISLSSDLNYNVKDNFGFLNAKNTFYSSGLTVLELTDQFKTNAENKFTIASKVVYTEPLWKNTFLELYYKFENNKNDAERTTYEKSGFMAGYNVVNDNLSNHFIFNNSAHTGGFNFKYQQKKINFSVGSGIGTIKFNLNDIETASQRSINYNNYLPSASIGYTPKKQTRYKLTYNGKTKNPTLAEIQPITDNTNPLDKTIGNPNLQQEFIHNFDFNFSKYQVIKSKNIYISANYNFTNNAIVYASTYDESNAKNVNQAVNVNGNYSFNLYSSYGFELAESFNLDINFNPTANRYINFVNNVKNINDSRSYKFSLGSSYWGEKKINYWFNFGPAYNTTKSTINAIETKYWSFNGNANINMKFKKIKTYIDIEAEANIFEKTGVFANATDVYNVKFGIKKSLDKAENWQLRLFVNDIFNTNANVDRSINSNFISQTTRQAIRRYALLSIIYNFSKNGKPSNGW
jgi:hypothetical protein